MKSPCIKVCEFDAGVCLGCGRTREEIRGWKKLDALGRQAVLAESDMRLLVFETQGRRRYK